MPVSLSSGYVAGICTLFSGTTGSGGGSLCSEHAPRKTRNASGKVRRDRDVIVLFMGSCCFIFGFRLLPCRRRGGLKDPENYLGQNTWNHIAGITLVFRMLMRI